MVVVVLPPNVEAEVQDGKRRADQACLHGQSNELRQQRRSLVEAGVGLVQIVHHAAGDNDVVDGGGAEPNLHVQAVRWHARLTTSEARHTAVVSKVCDCTSEKKRTSTSTCMQNHRFGATTFMTYILKSHRLSPPWHPHRHRN